MRRLVTVTALALTCLAGTQLLAQKMTDLGKGNGGSPHVRAEWTLDGAHIAIEYGRPSLKGRPEAQLMPPGQPWRTGADQATTITSDRPLTFASVKLAAGTVYTINTIPGEKGWELLFGKLEKPGQWGIPYQPALEIGKVPMKAGRTATPAEQLTISVDPAQGGGTLRIEWGTVSATAPFKIG